MSGVGDKVLLGAGIISGVGKRSVYVNLELRSIR